MLKRLTLLAVAALVAFTSTASAQRGEKKKSSQAAPAAGFTVRERDIIAAYFHDHDQQVQALPPGIAKNLARGKPLPPGLAKKRLPGPLVSQLPTRTGMEITLFGDRIVLLEAGGLVVDILDGLFH